MNNTAPVLTIDGPSGAGKGTISRLIAAQLGWHYLDSGALYRAIGVAAIQTDINLKDPQALEQCTTQTQIEFKELPQIGLRIYINGSDLTDQLRLETTATAASVIASYPQVRNALMERQRQFRQLPGLVADGRDMGTVIFPHAPYKIYLTAAPEERAQRRYKQLKDKGASVIFDEILREIVARDAQDAQRTVAPLKPASDAIVIDTTGLSIDEVIAQVKTLLPTTAH